MGNKTKKQRGGCTRDPGNDYTPAYPGLKLEGNGSFFAWREGNCVALYVFFVEGLHLYGCGSREFTTIGL